MVDVTESFLKYRECVRHLWNTYYCEMPQGESDFIFLQQALFHDIFVASFLDQELKPNHDGYYDRIAVGVHGSSTRRIIVRETSNGTIVRWGERVVDTDSLNLRFVDLFDFWYPRMVRETCTTLRPTSSQRLQHLTW